MNEAQWLACDDPAAMLDYLSSHNPSIYGRKLVLFGQSCYDAFSKAFRDSGLGLAAASHEELSTSWDVYIKTMPHLVSGSDRAALLREVMGNPFRPWCSEEDRKWADRDSVEADRSVTQLCGDRIVRKAWLTPTVLGIARQMYEDRDFTAMPVLADALQEAGCTDADMLGHLRGLTLCPTCGGRGKRTIQAIHPSYGNPLMKHATWETCYYSIHPSYGNPLMKHATWETCYHCRGACWVRPRKPSVHVRGCWVIDLLLGNE